MPNTNSDIQRKAGFFHSLGKVITEDANSAGNEKYKSAHNVRSNEVWMDSISYAPTSASASQYADGIIVKQVGSASGVSDVQNNFLEPLYLYPLTQTNYQTWFMDTGTPSAFVDGFVPSSEWVKPLISPVDVPNSAGAPSTGYNLIMFRPNGTNTISYSNAYYEVDYFAGLIRFQIGNTPVEGTGLGFTFNSSAFQLLTVDNATRKAYIQSTSTGGPRAIAWQYTGQRLSNYTFTSGGGTVSFEDSSTIGFTQSGVTYSAYVIPNSLTASSLNTGLSGGATAGYVLSNTGDGNFAWVPAGSGGVAGSAGTSGTSGSTGTSGTSGTSGISGSAGTSGTSGSTGTSGTSGTSGISGSAGTSGTSGSAGTSGTSGSAGTSGTSGSSGTSGISSTIEFHNTDTITFATQSISGGLSASATINLGSLTASHLNTGMSGGPTAGYVLSNTGDGNFSWIPAGSGSGTSLDVVDYITGETFSSISTMIFRGGSVTIPSPGSTATGVSVTGPAPTVTVWIPAPNYVGYFSPSLGGGTSRYIAQPTNSTYNTTPGNSGDFGIGSWSPATNFSANTTRPTINSSSNLTAFTESEFGCFNNGTTMSFTLYNHDGSVLSSIDNYVINGSGSTSSNGLVITVNSFLPDSDRYKANVSGTIAVGTLFPNGGRFSWNVKHYNGEGSGNAGFGIYSFTSSDILYDSDGSSSSANIAGGADFNELTPTTVQYSGVKFYAMSSTFALTASNINLLNDQTFPTTKQIDFTCTNLAVSGSLDGYADGTKGGVGSIITGWSIDWNNSGLTFSKTATVNSSSTYIPGFSTNNTISSSATSYVRSTIYDWSTVGFSQSVSRAMLFDTYSPSSVTYANNPLDSETGRLSTTGVMSSGTAAFDSTLSLSTTNVDELQYIFGRVIYPQSNFTAFYPTINWTASVDYSSLSGDNKIFTVYTDINTGATTSLTLNDYRWHVTSYGKDASYATSFANGIFVFNSNFSESVLHYDGVNSTAGTADLVIIVGFDDSSTNTTPNKFLFVSGNPSTYGTRQAPITYNLNKSASSKDIQWSKGTLSPVVKKIWLFIGYKNTVTGKNLNITNITFS
jgi:hypothetical protein